MPLQEAHFLLREPTVEKPARHLALSADILLIRTRAAWHPRAAPHASSALLSPESGAHFFQLDPLEHPPPLAVGLAPGGAAVRQLGPPGKRRRRL